MPRFNLRARLRLPALAASLSIGGNIGITSGGAGFVARPFLLQNDLTRLNAQIVANDPEWSGAISNPNGPAGFATVVAAAIADGGHNTWPPTGTYDDIWPEQLAIYGALSGDATAKSTAKAACLHMVRARPNGFNTSVDDWEYQTINDFILRSAGIVDLTFSLWSGSELTEVVNFVNGCLLYAKNRRITNWPGESPHNNYWNHQHLAWAIASVCGEGWVPSGTLTTWRTEFTAMCTSFVTRYTPTNWISGQPSLTEGTHYASYRYHSYEAMDLHDEFFGTSYFASSGLDYAAMLNAYLFMSRPDGAGTFSMGTESAATTSPWYENRLETMHLMMSKAPSSDAARYIKQFKADASFENSWGWPRRSKNICNFLKSSRPVSALALTGKTERMLHMPGGAVASGIGNGVTFLRSSNGWNLAAGAANLRAAAMFHGGAVNPDTVWGAAYSHSNPDGPGFQWCQGAAFLVADPEFKSHDGTYGEAGNPNAAFASNIVVLASGAAMPFTDQCAVLYAEDNTSAGVPHYYFSFNAQPQWVDATIYRRQYVWLDDLQVVVVHDRVATSGSNTKTFRMHFHGTTAVAGSTATCTTTLGGYTVRMRDLYATSGGTMTAGAPPGITYDTSENMTVVTQTDTANDFRSLKVFDVGGRCSAASLSSAAGYLQADMTINGVSRSVRFFDDGSHATVS